MTREELEKDGYQEVLGTDGMLYCKRIYGEIKYFNLLLQKEYYGEKILDLRNEDPRRDMGIKAALDINEYTINMPESLGTEPFIHPTAIIGPNVEIGDNTYIGPYCVIGYPAEHKEYWPYPDGTGMIGKVVIGENCVITGHVTIDAGTTRPTEVMDGVWMLKHSYVGHDAVIGSGATISCGAKIGGHAGVGENTNIGLNACVHQRIFVPEGCMVGMNSTITKKTILLPNRKYAGSPARDIGPNIKK